MRLLLFQLLRFKGIITEFFYMLQPLGHFLGCEHYEASMLGDRDVEACITGSAQHGAKYAIRPAPLFKQLARQGEELSV